MYINDKEKQPRVELRSPDALSNPYLAYALLIYAGLYGIENNLELPKAMDENSVMLPKSRKEAIKCAENSDFIKGLLPKTIIDKYI